MRASLFLLLALSATVVAETPAPSPPITVFGIPFQASLPMPECEFLPPTSRGSKAEYVFASPKDGSCYERNNPGSKEALDEESVSIKFPISKQPTLSKYDSVVARMLDNRVQRLWFWTSGLMLQDRDFESLTSKFGQPSQLATPIVQNRMGASFEQIEAIWKLQGNVTVVFHGAVGSTDRGQVVISTPAGDASFNAAMDKILNNGTQL